MQVLNLPLKRSGHGAKYDVLIRGGEAAGAAAALAVRCDGACATVDVEVLRRDLRRRGAMVDEDAMVESGSMHPKREAVRT